MLDSVIHRLYENGQLLATPQCETIRSYTYSYTGRLAKQTVTVNPVMEKTALIGIVERACDGNLQDMATVAMLYNTGYGLPYDEALAIAWVRFSTVQLADVAFVEACRLAKNSVRAAPDHIWPDMLTLPCMRAIDRLQNFDNVKKPEHCHVLPRFGGIRVYLFYRHVPGSTPHLYAGFYQRDEGLFIEVDKLIALGAPRYFGEVRNNVVIQSYTPFGGHHMYAVVATIGIPKSLTMQSKRIGKDVFEVFDAFVHDDSADLDMASFSTLYYEEELAKHTKNQTRLEKNIEKLERGPRRKQMKDELDTVNERIGQLSSIVKTSNPQEEYNDYKETRPKTYLKLVAHELYKWQHREFHCVALAPNSTQTHLQSLGFHSIKHPALEFACYIAENPTKKELRELAATFELAIDLPVVGLVMQPRSTNAPVRFCYIEGVK